MVEDAGGGVSNIQENAEQRPVLGIAMHALAQGFGVFERGERTINSANDLSEGNFGRRSLKLIPAMGAAMAGYDARALEFEQNCFQEFFRQLLLDGDISDFDHTRGMPPRQHGQGLQSVESSLRDSHKSASIPIKLSKSIKSLDLCQRKTPDFLEAHSLKPSCLRVRGLSHGGDPARMVNTYSLHNASDLI